MISLTTPVLISNGYHSIFIINLELIPRDLAKIIRNKSIQIHTITKIKLENVYAENKFILTFHMCILLLII